MNFLERCCCWTTNIGFLFQQFEPSYPEIIENIREAVQKKIEAEQECIKNEAEDKESENEKDENESLNKDDEEDEEARIEDTKAAATTEEEE